MWTNSCAWLWCDKRLLVHEQANRKDTCSFSIQHMLTQVHHLHHVPFASPFKCPTIPSRSQNPKLSSSLAVSSSSLTWTPLQPEQANPHSPTRRHVHHQLPLPHLRPLQHQARRPRAHRAAPRLRRLRHLPARVLPHGRPGAVRARPGRLPHGHCVRAVRAAQGCAGLGARTASVDRALHMAWLNVGTEEVRRR